MFSKLSFQRKCSQYEFYFKTIIVKTYLLIHQCFDNLLTNSHSISRTCPNRGMFYGRIRPFYGLVFGFLRARGEALCPLVFIIVVLQCMVNISGRKIFVFEKILLYFFSIWIYKKVRRTFSNCKNLFLRS